MLEKPKKCQLCNRLFGAKEIRFLLKIEMMADPSPPHITKEDMAKSWIDEMKALAKAMEDLDPGEAEDEVYEKYSFWLCRDCRRNLHDRLKFPFLSPE